MTAAEHAAHIPNPPSAPATIDLLRHGQPTRAGCLLGWRDEALSEAGWRQMHAALGDDLAWHRLYSSPLQRCAAFARDLEQRTGARLQVDDRWRELHFGAWEGRSTADLHTTEPDALSAFWRDPDAHPPPGGERFGQFEQRVTAAWQDLTTTLPRGSRALLVAHGGVIRVLLCHALGLPTTEQFRFEVPYASRTTLVVDGPDTRLRFENRFRHS